MGEANASISLPGSVVLVTGGTRGIGAGIARAFALAGASVVVCGRNAPAGPPSTSEGEIVFMPCDVRDSDAVGRLVDDILARYGRLDVLVNNAGGGPPADLADSSPRLVERLIALNLTAPLTCARSANAVMQRQDEGGCIINIASVAGCRPAPSTAVYGAAKAGLLHATESLAMEWGPRVRVNAIVAGFVATEEAGEHYGGSEGIGRIGAMFPLRRMAEPGDIASACLYLASPLAAYVSGARLAVHGGGEWPLFLHLARTRSAPGG